MRLSEICDIKPAVVTPYCGESARVLSRCHHSVACQTYPARHFFVADGLPDPAVDEFNAEHIILSKSHDDFGNTPRALGALSAINQGFNAVFFLDADNWYLHNHVEEGVKLKFQNSSIDVAASFRRIILPSNVEISPDQEDLDFCHLDTSCMGFFESAFMLLPFWATMTPELSPIGDRIVYQEMKSRNLKIEWTKRESVFYSSNYAHHYQRAGLQVPEDAYRLDLSMLKAFNSQKFLNWNGRPLAVAVDH